MTDTEREQLNDVGLISARMRMVDTQLLPRGIKHAAVLAAMRTVPRHLFVPPSLISEAYADHPVPIGFDQTISQPYVVASMTQELNIDRNSRVLEVGTGCGYQTAVLAEIARYVYSIECIPKLLADAGDRLKSLGYENVTYMVGDGALGWAEHAPYDGIIVTAAASHIPPALVEQLAINGRMVIPVADRGPLHQDLRLLIKTELGITESTLYGVRFVPMQGSAGESAD